ncbi:MAG: biotin--[acetyl-CoA-carboxylase] ligase [Candidatus Pacebacteria bacterium]|nr:biotin--[acetyl-CoA-carboxylase] ligase [Candidatus Paceibacterota bacterium]
MPIDDIIHFDSIDSTNYKAKELANDDHRDWTVVLADKQEVGHGKKSSPWFSPEGGLYFSIILPKANIKDIQIITILCSFVVADVIKNKYMIEPMIKLPNDIFINGKKFCGVLTENVISGNDVSSVIGVGIDTNIKDFPDGLKDIATSISLETGRHIDNLELLEEIVSELKKYFKEIIN